MRSAAARTAFSCSATIWMDVSGDQDEICGFAWG
jgi:hypothetical protein